MRGTTSIFVVASGRREGEKLFADRIEVVDPADSPVADDAVRGEITSRTENVLWVREASGRSVVVETGPETRIEILEAREIEGDLDELFSKDRLRPAAADDSRERP